MKSKAPIVLLILVSLGLGVALLVRHNRAVDQKQQDAAAIEQLRGQWKDVEGTLAEEKAQAARLQTDLKTKEAELASASVALVEVRSALSQTETEAKETRDLLELTKAEVEKRDARIQELESANNVLDEQAEELRTAITDREGRITDTERRLAASEGDRAFLLTELKRLQVEKSDLERQFNDLVVLKEQVRKLKEELTVQKKLDWVRRGVGNSNRKGAELLQRGLPRAERTAPPIPDLNVEIRREGPATIVPPEGGTP